MLFFIDVADVMAQVLKEIVSSQKFLNGVKTLPHFEELQRKQLERLKIIVKKHAISVEMAGRIMESFSDVWSGRVLDELKALIAEQSETQEDTSSRAGLQDFTALPGYLSKEWWSKLESRAAGVYKLELLTNFAARLGLKNPTEASYGALVALSFFADNLKVWPELEQVKLLRTHKERMRRWLTKAPAASVRLEVLPDNPSEIPVPLFTAVFPEGLVPGVPDIIDIARLRRVIADFRLRGRKDGDYPTPSVSTSGQLDAAALVQAAASLVASVHKQSRQNDVDLPGFRMLDVRKEEQKGASTSLALQDGQRVVAAAQPSEAMEGNIERCEDQACTPKDAIAALREELKLKGTGAHGKDAETMSRKKPATCGKGKKKEMAKPAACVKKTLKRPASVLASSPVGGMCDFGARSDRREALLKKIPKKVLHQYKDGCSRCYHRAFCTVSCWARRGFTIE